jgi:hypothetical protein
MKRLLIEEVEPKMDCPRECPGCPDECSLPKIEGTTKRLLIREVEPARDRLFPESHRTNCPYHRFWKTCIHPKRPALWSGLEPSCSDENCPLPKTDPDRGDSYA